MNQNIVASEVNRPPASRTQSYELRGRSASTRYFQDVQPELTLPEFQFRPAEVVKNIQKVSDNRPPSTSTSRETSTVRRDLSIMRREHFPVLEQTHDGKRSSSIVSVNYKVSRVHSNLNPNATPNITSRYRNPMLAYSSNEVIEMIVPNHSNMLHQKYQRPSIVSRPSNESKTSKYNQYQAPKSTNSISMDCQDLVPAFNDLTIELGEAMDESIDDNRNFFEIDNKFSDSQPASTNSNLNSENSSLNISSFNDDTSSRNSLPKNREENKKEELMVNKGLEKSGRIQQRVNYLKQMKDSEESNSTSKWKNFSVEQRMFFESLNNDVRNLKRSNYKPLHDSLERTSDQKILDSSASVTSQYLLKTYYPMKESRNTYTPISNKSGEPDIPKLKELLSQSTQIAELMWKAEDRPSTSQTRIRSEPNDKSPTDAAYSSFDSDGIILVTHTFEPKDLKAIKESLDGYEINNEAPVKNDDSELPSPLSKRV